MSTGGTTGENWTHKFGCHAHERNGGHQEDNTRPGVYVRFCFRKLAFLAQCFFRDFGMRHGFVVLARRVVQVETRADVAGGYVSLCEDKVR